MCELLKDKTAVITGGGRGIGRAISTEFISEGCSVIILDKFFPDDFNGYVNEMKTKFNSSVLHKSVDVTNFESVNKAVDEIIKEVKKIDILVNNAGITRDKLIMRMSEEDWDAVITVNLKGAFNMIKAVTMHMARQKYGKIINISSVVGVSGNAGQANYSASKAGMIGLAKSTAKEFAGRNITVNCIAPGFVETEMTAILSEEQRKAFLNVIPLKRSCKPDEIAGVTAFLASSKSDYITGQVICVDGGMIM
jgi:3-oxoacyl-[acyl-carrier protein] reductase